LRGYLRSILEPDAATQVAPLVTVSWQDILLEAQRLTTASHTLDGSGSLLSDFVDYLGASSGALGWQGDLRSFADLCATPPAHRNPIWRSAVSQRVEEWTCQVADRLAGGFIDASVIGQRWCVRLDWGWAREINVRLDCGNGLFLERQDWERAEGVHPVAIETYLTLGDTLGQMARLSPQLDPWQVVAPEWTMKGYLGFMHFQGKGIHFVPIAREQSSHAWQNRQTMLRRYLRSAAPNPPFPADTAWDTCRETWSQYWRKGRKGFVVLTARVEIHRGFAINQGALPAPNTIADAFTDLHNRIEAAHQRVQR
jgi:hypothetical protein